MVFLSWLPKMRRPEAWNWSCQQRRHNVDSGPYSESLNLVPQAPGRRQHISGPGLVLVSPPHNNSETHGRNQAWRDGLRLVASKILPSSALPVQSLCREKSDTLVQAGMQCRQFALEQSRLLENRNLRFHVNLQEIDSSHLLDLDQVTGGLVCVCVWLCPTGTTGIGMVNVA